MSNSIQVLEKKLSDVSVEYYEQYAKFIGSMRGTVDITGLKRVHLRILYALSTMSNKEKVKTISLMGETIGKYHPHADSGTSDAIYTLVKQGLLWKYGNWGNFHRAIEYRKPAAERYTSVGWTPFLNYVFENINYVKFIEGQIYPFTEPVTLPTPIPMALINGEPFTQTSLMSGMSHGIASKYPQFKFNDLINFVIDNVKTDWKSKKYPKIFFGDNVEIIEQKNSDKDIWEKLTDFSIKLKPVVEANPTTREIHVYCLTNNYFTKGDKIKEITDKCDTFSDLSTSTYTDVYMKFTRKNYFDKYYEEIQNKMKVSSKFMININVNLENIGAITLKNWLKLSYDIYKETTLLRLTDDKRKLEETLYEYQLIEKLRPLVRESLQETDSINKLYSLAVDQGFDLEIVKRIISKYSMRKLLNIKLDISEIMDKIEALSNNINNIQNYIIDKYKEMKTGCKYFGSVFVYED